MTSNPTPSAKRRPPIATEVTITIQTIGIGGRQKHTSARVLSFDTLQSPKEVLALLSVLADMFRNYQPQPLPRLDHES